MGHFGILQPVVLLGRWGLGKVAANILEGVGPPMAGLEGIKFDHYLLTKEIGRGGMATVFLATDTLTQEKVAIKVLSPSISGDSRFVRRFQRESSLLSQLEHPNIVSVVDFGESQGMIYMVMPYVEGDTLQDRIDAGAVTDEQREKWIRQIAWALDFAHHRGIIHRDVKPSNVMIDPSDNALLTDFGLARATEGTSTLTGSMLLGTPAYISPEQGKGEPVDERSDQYSLGVILYQLAAGRLPFESDVPMGTVLMHIRDPVPRPSRFNPDISPAMERVILKSLAKDPEFRYPTVGALHEAYRAALEGAAMEDLDFETQVLPLDPALRELREAYRVSAQATAAEETPRSKLRGWIILAIVLVAALGSAFGVPIAMDWMNPPGPTLEQAVSTIEEPTVQPAASIAPATRTPLPTLAPVTSDACPGIILFPPKASGNEVAWSIDNAGAAPVVLQQMDLVTYPSTNEVAEEIYLGDALIWMNGDQGFRQEVTLRPGEVGVLRVLFKYSAAPRGYHLILDLGSGCTLEGNWE